jgi:hypothetical protein
VIRDAGGRFVGRVDFYWDAFGVVGEADGLAKYESASSRVAEKRREPRLESCGLLVVRWGWDDVWRFDAVAARLRSRFRLGQQAGTRRGWMALDRSDFAPEFDVI